MRYILYLKEREKRKLSFAYKLLILFYRDKNRICKMHTKPVYNKII